MIRIINADVVDGLRSLPDKSVHCVVTSPPYWGLRHYGTSEQIWAGRGKMCVEHVWEDASHRVHSGTTKSKINGNPNRHFIHKSANGKLCSVCGAWAGE